MKLTVVKCRHTHIYKYKKSSLSYGKDYGNLICNTVKPRFTGPRFAGEPRFAGQEPADQTFHYISLLQKPRFTGQKTPILGIFPKKSRDNVLIFSIKLGFQM